MSESYTSENLLDRLSDPRALEHTVLLIARAGG